MVKGLWGLTWVSGFQVAFHGALGGPKMILVALWLGGRGASRNLGLHIWLNSSQPAFIHPSLGLHLTFGLTKGFFVLQNV